jgi:hypothetical protein
MQHIRTLNLLFSGTPLFRFNRHQNRLFLDIDWSRDVAVGQYVVINAYRKMDPDNQTMTGTVETTVSSNTIIGTSTRFDQDMLPGDEISIGGETRRVVDISSPTVMNVSPEMVSTNSDLTIIKSGLSDVWNDRFLKRYATALVKLQWGNNLSKFSGIQMPGGVTLDGVRIATEAQVEIDKLEEEMQSFNVLPNEMFMG